VGGTAHIKLDLHIPLVGDPASGHNRWHPSIPGIAGVRPGKTIEVDIRDGLDGQITPHTRAEDILVLDFNVNDHRFTTAPGFDWGEPFFQYARDAFDVLYAERDEAPRMMAIGLHSRLVGRPGRFRALERFLDHVQCHEGVWLCRGIDIAEL
jgi:peptidoglycan/xylan/chitin deacetylase (PgdA/CDA1 family)